MFDSGPDDGVAGVSIGDVGILSPESYFDFFFNLCLPTDHIVNTYLYPPDGFEPVRREDGDVEVTPLYSIRELSLVPVLA